MSAFTAAPSRDVATTVAADHSWPRARRQRARQRRVRGGVGARRRTDVIKVAHASHELARARMRARGRGAATAIGRAGGAALLTTSGVLADGRAWIVMDRVDRHEPRRPHRRRADCARRRRSRSGCAILDVARARARARVRASRSQARQPRPHARRLRVVILDLGLARKLPDDPDDPTRAGVQVGSLEYMPPEQIADSANVDERSRSVRVRLRALRAARGPAAVRRRRGGARARARGAAAAAARRAGHDSGGGRVSCVDDCLAKEPARRPASVARGASADSLLRATNGRRRATTHSVSVIREGKQPVVLLWAELPRVDRALLGDADGRRLVIASQRGRARARGRARRRARRSGGRRDRGGARSRARGCAGRAASRGAARRRRAAARRRCTASPRREAGDVAAGRRRGPASC